MVALFEVCDAVVFVCVAAFGKGLVTDFASEGFETVGCANVERKIGGGGGQVGAKVTGGGGGEGGDRGGDEGWGKGFLGRDWGEGWEVERLGWGEEELNGVLRERGRGLGGG